MSEWFTVTLVERLTLLENQLVGESGFSVVNTMSLSDVVLFTFINEFFDNNGCTNVTLTSPKICAVVDRVSSDEKVVKWLNERPKTPF